MELMILDRLLVPARPNQERADGHARRQRHSRIQDEISAAWRETRAAGVHGISRLGMNRLITAVKSRATSNQLGVRPALDVCSYTCLRFDQMAFSWRRPNSCNHRRRHKPHQPVRFKKPRPLHPG
jgi:hypothetical protein